MELLLNHSQVMSTVAFIPSYGGKLRAVIEVRRSEKGDEITARELLGACNSIPSSIYGAVREELERQGELKHCVLAGIGMHLLVM